MHNSLKTKDGVRPKQRASRLEAEAIFAVVLSLGEPFPQPPKRYS